MSCDVQNLLFHRGKRRIEQLGLAWVNDFGDLHDHIDANGVTSIAFDFEWEPGIAPENDEGVPDFDEVEKAHWALDAWLRFLAPPATLFDKRDRR